MLLYYILSYIIVILQPVAQLGCHRRKYLRFQWPLLAYGQSRGHQTRGPYYRHRHSSKAQRKIKCVYKQKGGYIFTVNCIVLIIFMHNKQLNVCCICVSPYFTCQKHNSYVSSNSYNYLRIYHYQLIQQDGCQYKFVE